MLSLPTLIILIILVAGAVGSVLWVVLSQFKSIKQEIKSNEDGKVLMEWLKEMRGSVEKTEATLDKQLKDQREAITKQTKMIWERLENSSKVIQQVQHQLGGITEFGRDMKDLSNILKSPKLRGGLGEQFLYEILGNSLPKELFKTQYRFKDGSTADAVLITDKGMIAVDSKFPMENFKAMVTTETQDERDRFKKVFVRDVKTRIDEIASKYILPDEGTTQFAVMYIPSESVFYELITNTAEIENYARQKKIFLTSPNTFHYQVQAILVAYQQNELQKHAGEILKSLSGIKVEAGKFDEELGTLERHITHSYKAMDIVKIRFSRLFGKIESAAELGSGKDEDISLIE